MQGCRTRIDPHRQTQKARAKWLNRPPMPLRCGNPPPVSKLQQQQLSKPTTQSGPIAFNTSSKRKIWRPVKDYPPFNRSSFVDSHKQMLILKQFWEDESGQDLIEYCLLLAFVALCAVGLLTGIRTSVSGLWSQTNSSLISAQTVAS
jgi:Flp pilus assembly pilin Flp